MEACIHFKQAGLTDLNVLFKISRQSYTENFAHHWEHGCLAWYLEEVFGETHLEKGLKDKNVQYYIAYFNDSPAGFMKLNINGKVKDYSPEEGLEIEKIYIRPKFQGEGIGKKLFKKAIALANQLNKKIIWLDVIDTNSKAMEFYQKMGFSAYDRITFNLPGFKKEIRGMWRMVRKMTDD